MGAAVGEAGSEVIEMSVVLELGKSLDLVGGKGEMLEDLKDVGFFLH